MKTIVHKITKMIMLLFIIISIPVTLLAQLPPEEPDDVADVPFDEGVGVLVAVAIGYGMVRIITHQKKEKVIIAETKTFS